jgi:hypothetical protein
MKRQAEQIFEEKAKEPSSLQLSACLFITLAAYTLALWVAWPQ